MPIGAHTILSFLAEPLKQLSETLNASIDYNVSEDMREFQDWVCLIALTCFGSLQLNLIFRALAITSSSNTNMNFKFYQNEYYSCDASYRSWLKIELENAEVPVSELSLEEKERTISTAKEMLNASLSLLESEFT